MDKAVAFLYPLHFWWTRVRKLNVAENIYYRAGIVFLLRPFSRARFVTRAQCNRVRLDGRARSPLRSERRELPLSRPLGS